MSHESMATQLGQLIGQAVGKAVGQALGEALVGSSAQCLQPDAEVECTRLVEAHPPLAEASTSGLRTYFDVEALLGQRKQQCRSAVAGDRNDHDERPVLSFDPSAGGGQQSCTCSCSW